MTKKLFQIFVTQFILIEVMSSYIQPYSLRPYITRESPQIPQKSYITEHKAYHNYPQNYPYPAYKIAEPVAIPIVAPRPEHLPEVPNLKPTVPITNNLELPNQCSGKLDSNVLNNLAIALQLLIVNNIISNPPDANQFVSPLTQTVLELALPSSKLNSHEDFPMPNSKFLGSSSFGSDVMSKAMMVNPAPPRAGLSLMSPYDAIAKSYPMSESLASPYLSKRDFQSPYAAIMAADNTKDLFSMDFF